MPKSKTLRRSERLKASKATKKRQTRTPFIGPNQGNQVNQGFEQLFARFRQLATTVRNEPLPRSGSVRSPTPSRSASRSASRSRSRSRSGSRNRINVGHR